MPITLPLYSILIISFSDPKFFQLSFLSKTFYIVAVTSLTRHVYYTGWMLGDSICNMSGMGFNGYNADGTAKWNLVSNVDILGVEVRFLLSLSFSFLLSFFDNTGTIY